MRRAAPRPALPCLAPRAFPADVAASAAPLLVASTSFSRDNPENVTQGLRAREAGVRGCRSRQGTAVQGDRRVCLFPHCRLALLLLSLACPSLPELSCRQAASILTHCPHCPPSRRRSPCPRTRSRLCQRWARAIGIVGRRLSAEEMRFAAPDPQCPAFCPRAPRFRSGPSRPPSRSS